MKYVHHYYLTAILIPPPCQPEADSDLPMASLLATPLSDLVADELSRACLEGGERDGEREEEGGGEDGKEEAEETHQLSHQIFK